MLSKLCEVFGYISILCLIYALFYFKTNTPYAIHILAWITLLSTILYLIKAAATGKAGTKTVHDADINDNPIAFYLHVIWMAILLIACIGYLITCSPFCDGCGEKVRAKQVRVGNDF